MCASNATRSSHGHCKNCEGRFSSWVRQSLLFSPQAIWQGHTPITLLFSLQQKVVWSAFDSLSFLLANRVLGILFISPFFCFMSFCHAHVCVLTVLWLKRCVLNWVMLKFETWSTLIVWWFFYLNFRCHEWVFCVGRLSKWTNELIVWWFRICLSLWRWFHLWLLYWLVLERSFSWVVSFDWFA